MSKVFVNIGLSLDGYMAPEGMTIDNWDNPECENWGAKWGALMAWILSQQYFRETLKFGPGGETGPVNDMCVTPWSAPAPTSWARECSSKARSHGPRRLRFTLRYTFLLTRSANLGSGREGRRSTSSTTARRVPLSR